MGELDLPIYRQYHKEHRITAMDIEEYLLKDYNPPKVNAKRFYQTYRMFFKKPRQVTVKLDVNSYFRTQTFDGFENHCTYKCIIRCVKVRVNNYKKVFRFIITSHEAHPKDDTLRQFEVGGIVLNGETFHQHFKIIKYGW